MGWNCFSKVVKKCSLYFQMNVLGEKLCLREIYNFIYFLRDSGEKIWAGFSNLRSTYPEEHFRKRFLV